MRNILTVFLASPSDLSPERTAVRDVVEELNQSLRDIGWQIELLGWEDTIPGAGRPQELINPDVDSCHLFFGMLWKRWGQPTGKFSSGFEEEFARALARRNETDEPEIMLVFKDVDDPSDPGEQLQRVIAFQKERIESRDVLFHHFSDLEVLKKKLRTWLTKCIYRLNASLGVQGTMDAKPILPQTAQDNDAQTAGSVGDGKDADSPRAEIIKAAKSAIAFYEKSEDLNVEAAERLQLFAMTVTSRHTTSEAIPVHFANLVYLKRDKYAVSEAEVDLLFRTLVESTGDNIPGWFWVRKWDRGRLIKYLGSLLANSADEALRRNTVSLLIDIAEPLFEGQDPSFLHDLLTDKSEQLKLAGLELAIGGNEDVLEVVNTLESDASAMVRAKAFEVKLQLLLRHSPEKAMALIKEPDFPTQLELKDDGLLSSVFKNLGDEQLVEFLNHPTGTVVTASFRELEFRGLLTEELARPLLSKSDAKVRENVFAFLVSKANVADMRKLISEMPDADHWWPYFTLGRDYPEINRIRSRAYARLGLEVLYEELDYYSLETPYVLRGLGEAFPEDAATLIRGFFDDDFATFRESSKKRLQVKFDSTTVDALINPDYLFKGSLEEVCLAVLTAVGRPDDVKYGRRYVESTNPAIQLEAIYLVNRFGDDGDAATLSEALSTGKLEVPTAAAKALIETAVDKAAMIRKLLEFKDPKVISLAISTLMAPTEAGVEELLFSLLRDERDAVRIAAASYFVRTTGRENLAELLAQYLADGSAYYYNVVHYFDAILYAPETIKDKMTREASDRATTEFPDLNSPYH